MIDDKWNTTQKREVFDKIIFNCSIMKTGRNINLRTIAASNIE
ncbi:MAG: hypothetical protein BWY67_01674 [Bacteroidetes bacterium ADurb.Bin397]|jgi:hypothetical protein|nr:MAG: hypothetical protein BWY67_01674 [Bacteroidetes bacterium ADurb.Bin397]